MNDQERIDEAVAHLKEAVHVEARRSLWIRLLSALRVKISGIPPNKVEVTGNVEF